MSQVFSNCSPKFVRDFGKLFSDQLCEGLSDIWPQVRLACCSASRHFMLTIKSLFLNQKKELLKKEKKEKKNKKKAKNEEENNNGDSFDYWRCYEQFVPPLCFNRYYDAEGVRLFNMESWTKITEGEGKSIVSKLIKQVLHYYFERAKSENENDREASYHCISEILIKIDKKLILPHLPSIKEILLLGLKDDVWNVKESSSYCCGRFFTSFPQASKDENFDLIDQLSILLGDTFPSVRLNAAISLSQFLESSPFASSLFKSYFLPLLSHLLPLAILQPSYHKNNPNTPQTNLPFHLKINPPPFIQTNPSPQQNFLKTSFPSPFLSNNFAKKENFLDILKEMEKIEKQGEIFDKNQKKKRDNDLEIHTNQESFSCCNFEPQKSKKEKDETDVWEKSDGAVSLFAELSKIFPDECFNLLEIFSKISSLMHFPLYHILLQNLWNSLPVISTNIQKFDKNTFLTLFLPHLKRVVESTDNRHLLTSIYPSFTFFVKKFDLKESDDKDQIYHLYSIFEKHNIK